MSPSAGDSFWNAAMAASASINQITIDGVETRVVVAGAAHRESGIVVLLHGTSGHLESFIYNLAPLARSAMVIAYDLPWHGMSGRPERPYEIDDYERHLWALADVLDLPRFDVVGQSMGAWIAARAALRRPERVRRTVLIGAGGAEGATYPGPGTMQAHLSADLTEELVRRRLSFASGSGHAIPDELVQCRLAHYQRGDWATEVEAFTYQRNESVWNRNVLSEQEWGKIAGPVLLIWGSEDRVVPPHIGSRLARWIPGARLEVIAGTGHLPQFEAPEQVSQLLVEFLAEPEPQANSSA